jgi:formate-dependent nitrite reductase membrane component NrfD
MGLLVADLKRPERFLLLLARPQWKSWLVRGAFVLMAAALLAVGYGMAALYKPSVTWLWRPLGLAAAIGGGAAAGYTAFLFAQARGRRLWQSPLLLPHLVVQAGLAGSAALSFVPGFLNRTRVAPVLWDERLQLLGTAMAIFLVLNLLMILGELWSHASREAAAAGRWMRTGEQGATLFLGVFALGHVFPAVALFLSFKLDGAVSAVGLAGIASLLGVALWDHLFVRAGQIPPLS